MIDDRPAITNVLLFKKFKNFYCITYKLSQYSTKKNLSKKMNGRFMYLNFFLFN